MLSKELSKRKVFSKAKNSYSTVIASLHATEVTIRANTFTQHKPDKKSMGFYTGGSVYLDWRCPDFVYEMRKISNRAELTSHKRKKELHAIYSNIEAPKRFLEFYVGDAEILIQKLKEAIKVSKAKQVVCVGCAFCKPKRKRKNRIK